MAFSKVNGYHKIKTFPISSLVVTKGALLAYTAGAASVSLYTTDTAVPVLGIAQETTTTASTNIQVDVTLTGDFLEGDVDEIVDATVLTSDGTGGTATTFVDSSFVAGQDDVLIGAKFVVLGMASTDKPVGTVLTATDYTSTGGTIQFASLGTTGFNTGDTIKLISLSNRICGCESLAINATTADAFTLNGTGAGGGTFFKAIEVSDDGKKIRGYLTAGFDLTDVVSA